MEICLTERQRAIVELEEGEHLVLAPPGTGKTELLALRILRALERGHDPDRMIVLTFTNRAARNMRQRVEERGAGEGVFIGNIHAFAYDFLHRNGVIPYDASLLDEEDVNQIFTELTEERGRPELQRGGAAKNPQLAAFAADRKMEAFGVPAWLRKRPELPFTPEGERLAIRIAGDYEALKRESAFLDFDDLLALLYRELKGRKDQEPLFDWMQVDEVQDLNPLQWELLEMLAPHGRSHRVFFGDMEQAIFSFMGAKLESLDAVKERAKVHHLYENFRSPEHLLNFFTEYARTWLAPAWEEEPRAHRKEEAGKGALNFREVEGEESAERQWLLRNFFRGEPKEPTAILVRTNRTADAFTEALNQKGLSFFKISGFDLFRRKEVKDLLAFFQVLVSEGDRNAWTRLWQLYGRGPSLKEARQLVNRLFGAGFRPVDFQEDIGPVPPDAFLDAWTHRRIVVFDTETTGLDPERDRIVQIAAVALEGGRETGRFERYLRSNEPLGDSTRIHGIDEEFLAKEGVDPSLGLGEFLDFLGDSVLVAHNLDFDWSMLQHSLRRAGKEPLPENRERYDSLDLSRRAWPGEKSYKLGRLLDRLGLAGVNSHNAMDDVLATSNLLGAIARRFGETQGEREAFRRIYRLWIERFAKHYTPPYRAVTGRFGEDLSLRELMEMVLGYMQDRLGVRMGPELYDELEKLLRHMETQERLGNARRTLRRYIPEYSRYREADLVLGDEKIVVATIHKAKGLEFSNVVIPSCTDSVFPDWRSLKAGPEAVREDARLLYVAMTRAKRRLLFSSHTVGRRGYETTEEKPSRFLEPFLGRVIDYRSVGGEKR